MKKSLVSLFLVVGVFSNLSQAAAPADLHPIRTLRKLTWQLANRDALVSEREALKQAMQAEKSKPGTVDDFFAKKAAELVASDGFIDRMIYNLNSHFRLPSYKITDIRTSRDRSGAELLFQEILEKNLSWDTLLLKRELTLPKTEVIIQVPAATEVTVDTASFFKKVSSEYVSTAASPNTLQVSFSEQSKSVAGILSTPTFFYRYKASASNKNRRFGQAVFRTFLCDSLKPVALPLGKEDPDQEIMTKIKAHLSKSMTNPSASAVVSINKIEAEMEKKHETDQACVNCHVKIDPMGKLFGSPGSSELQPASAGGLVFPRGDKGLFKAEGSGISEVAKAIIDQPEYLKCQAKIFWEWIIGKPAPLSEKRMTELGAVFASAEIGRRPRDFAAYIASLPEFKKDWSAAVLSESEMIYAKLKPILADCNSCHGGTKVAGIEAVFKADFTRIDEMNQVDRLKVLTEMNKRLNLPAADPKSMPRNRPSWNQDSIDAIKKWIKESLMRETQP